MSHPRSAHRGLSVRDPNQETPRSPEGGGRKVSKTPFRSTPRPPLDWAKAASRVVFVSPAKVESAEATADGEGAVDCVPPLLLVHSRLRRAIDQWKDFRAVRLRHVGLLMQVSPSVNPVLSSFLRVCACETDVDHLQALLWRAQAVFWAWSTQAAAQQAARQCDSLNSQLLSTRLLAMLGRRRRRIFERWRVWAVHAELLRAGEERAVIAGQSWRAARVFHSWHEWARCSSVCTDLLRFRQHQCLGCWRRAVAAQRALQARIMEACGWHSSRMLQTSIDKLWMFAAQQQRLASIMNQIIQIREWRVLDQCLSGWRLATVAAIEKHETKVVAKAFWRENVGSSQLLISSISRLTTDFSSVSLYVRIITKGPRELGSSMES